MLRRSVVSIVVLLWTLATAGTPARAQQPPGAPTGGSCGNKLLDADETCEQCPADCVAQSCKPGPSRTRVAVEFVPPESPDISSAVLRIGYRTDRLSLPSAGSDKGVRARLTGATDFAMLVPNDLDYALRVVVGRPAGIAHGHLLTIEFDRCQGTPRPTASDLSCVVEACASSNGPQNCSCTITEVKG
jgi:hypothetical protein